MNEITLAKVQFKDALIAEGLDVVEYIPERIIPPVVVIKPSTQYLQVATLGSEYDLGLELILITATATNEYASEELDTLIQDTLKALPNYAVMTGVEKPYTLSANNAEYLATSIQVNLSITI